MIFPGLGSDAFSLRGMVPLTYSAQKKGLIDKNVITLALAGEGPKSVNLPGGVITYGAIDDQNCGPVTTYVPRVVEQPSFVNMDGISFGQFEMPRNAMPTNWTYFALGAK